MHDQVINLSLGGASNTESLIRLENLLIKYRADQSDTFYWIVTNPIRCKELKTVSWTSGIEHNLTELLKASLKRANDLAKKYQIKIKLIGGLCDVNEDMIKDFDHLQIVVPSWIKLCNDQYPSSIFSQDQWTELGELVRSLNQPGLIEEWLDLTKKIENKTKFYKKHPMYFFRQDNHPNRRAHKVLRDFLYPDFAHCF